MDRKHAGVGLAKKNVRATARETSDALFLLRCVQLGLQISELELLTVGMVFDMLDESANDEEDWPELATQEDYDKF